ncbi:Uncharacterised protein [Vibrio cholerae]|nr:Uncharacterised protein [Vibrio cholerae]
MSRQQASSQPSIGSESDSAVHAKNRSRKRT